MGFRYNDRVQRIGKSWGNVHPGMTGTVVDADVDGNGKKVRVKFDGYVSDRTDGTVIVMAKSLGKIVTVESLLAGAREQVRENIKAPIRGDPFFGARTGRVQVTLKRKGPSVEHVDLTQPLHAPHVPRPSDYVFMSDYSDSEELEGLVGEGMDEDKQVWMAQRIDERLAARPRVKRSWQALIRATLPFTKLEQALRGRQFDADRLFHKRGMALATALEKTAKAVK